MFKSAVFTLLLMMCPLYAESLSLVAVTDPGCHFCQSWHDQVMPSYAAKARVYNYPELMVKDYSSRWDRAWIRDHLQHSIEGLPTFFITSGDVVLAEFSGFSSYDDFYKSLDDSLQKASNYSGKVSKK